MFSTLTARNFSEHSKHLWILVFPILITQFCQSGLGLVDAMMAGQVSTTDLAAVSVATSIWLPIFLSVTGILIAITPLVGEALGRESDRDIPHITQQGLWTGLFIGIVGFFVIRLMPAIFPFFNVTESVRPIAEEYLYWVAFGFPALALYIVLRCYSEALERPAPVTVISIIGLLADIPLNYVFIHGHFGFPAMGGAGCGVATAIIMWMNVILLASYLSLSSSDIFTKYRFFSGFSRPNRQKIIKIVKLGIPIGASIFFEVSLFGLATLVISPLGEYATASHQVVLSISGQLFMIPMSIAMGITIMASSRYGEGNLISLREVISTGLIWSTLLALLSMLGIYVFRSQLVEAFSNDPYVQQLAISLLLYAMAYQIFDSIQVNIAGVLRGIQDTQITMIITFFCYWLVALPLGVYLVHYTDMGVGGFWLALNLGLFLAAVLLTMRLKQQQHNLTIKFG